MFGPDGRILLQSGWEETPVRCESDSSTFPVGLEFSLGSTGSLIGGVTTWNSKSRIKNKAESQTGFSLFALPLGLEPRTL